jgi:hypothetical protein
MNAHCITLTGEDFVVINGTVLADVADQDWGQLEFDADIANVKNSKNGNLLFAYNTTGDQGKLTMRIAVGSANDKFLTSVLNTMKADFSSFHLITGSFVKRVGDGNGKITTKVYELGGGVFKRQPNIKSNSEGDITQSVAVWEITFGHVSPTIQ